VCAACSRPWGGDTAEGEAVVFRFAVVVDFGKGWPIARRVGEGPGIAAALETAGYSVPSPPDARPRAAEDDPRSPAFDREVLRSPYGDPAPPIAETFLRVVEETMGTVFDSIPEFY